MNAKLTTLSLLLPLCVGCKSQGDDAPAQAPEAATPAAAAKTETEPAAPAKSPGAMATVAPAGLEKADPGVVAWLRTAAKCDLHLTPPDADQLLIEQTWGDQWSWDDCPAKDTLFDVEAESEAIDAAMLDALADADRNVRLLATYNLAGGYAKDGRADALGKLLYAAGHESDPHVGAQLALVIDSELGELEKLEGSPHARPFVVALTDVLARTSNQGLLAEDDLSCEIEGCAQMWARVSRDNPSPTLRALAFEQAYGVLDEEQRCALGLELVTSNDEPIVLQHAAEALGSCREGKTASTLVARLDQLTIQGPGAVHLWNALDTLGPEDPAVEAKISSWARTIVDEKLGDDEIRKNAEFALSL